MLVNLAQNRPQGVFHHHSDQVDSSDNQEGEQMDTKDKFVDWTKSLYGMKNVILLIWSRLEYNLDILKEL